MKKVIISTLCLVLTITTFGQKKKNINPDFFNRKVSFGIVTGIGQSAFKIKETNWNQTTLKDTFNSVIANSGLLVIIGNEVKFKITNNFSYRQRLLLNFESTTLQFDTKKHGVKKLKVQNVVIEAPIHFIFQRTFDNKRPYILLGSTLKYNLGQSKDVKDKFQIKPFDMTADLGIGIEIKLMKFLIAPELNFSQSLLNIQKNIGTNYSNTISKLGRQNVIFTIAVR